MSPADYLHLEPRDTATHRGYEVYLNGKLLGVLVQERGADGAREPWLASDAEGQPVGQFPAGDLLAAALQLATRAGSLA